MLIFLSGGGTMGSVSPLLALAQELDRARPGTHFFWIGTRNGPERTLVEEAGIAFRPIFSGKWRRYVDWRNVMAPLLLVIGFWQSVLLVLRYRPSVIVSAGSFVSVPLVWAGFLLRVPSIIHQQDICVGLANKLMQPFAKKITVAFQEQLTLFSAAKTVWTGNPVRVEMLQGDRVKALGLFQLEEARQNFDKNLGGQGIPTVLVTGGGTGAEFLNKLVVDALPELTKFCQVIHLNPRLSLYGRGPADLPAEALAKAGGGGEGVSARYHFYDFLTSEMPHALAVADLVICRAGMGTLTELAALGKPAIVIPMPNTHQEENAALFKAHQAVEVIHQNNLTPEIFVDKIRELLTNVPLQQKLSGNIKRLMPVFAAVRMAEVVVTCVQKT